MKIVSILLLFICFCSCEESQPVKTGLEGQIMPSFEILLQDSSGVVNVANIAAGKPAVLFYFRPDCPFCKLQVKDIISQATSLASVRFYLLSPSPLNEIAGFSQTYGLEKFGNIIVGQDHSFSFTKYFRPAGVPFMAIYGPDISLREVYLGNVSPNVIKEATI